MSDFILIHALRSASHQPGRRDRIGISRPRNQLSRVEPCGQSKWRKRLLAEGIAPHARVAFWAPIQILYFHLLFGVQKTRSVLVGVNSRLAGPEVAYVLNDAKAEMVFVGKDFVPLIETILADCPDRQAGHRHGWRSR
jgi:long-subunit acyl-CoA synthetase (AMP-forming)